MKKLFLYLTMIIFTSIHSMQNDTPLEKILRECQRQMLACKDAHNIEIILKNTHQTLLQFFISNQMNPNDNTHAFLRAASIGNQAIIDLFIAVGFKSNQRLSNNTTPLMSAAIHGNVDTAKALLNHGADVTVINNNGESALSMAIFVCEISENDSRLFCADAIIPFTYIPIINIANKRYPDQKSFQECKKLIEEALTTRTLLMKKKNKCTIL